MRGVHPSLVDELLPFLRSRLRADQFTPNGALERELRNRYGGLQSADCDELAHNLTQLVSLTIEGDIRDDADREALRIMTGLDPRFALGRSLNRSVIVSAMGEVLARRRGSQDAPALGRRRVEQLERTHLAPTLLAAMFPGNKPQSPTATVWRDCEVRCRLGPQMPNGLMQYASSLRFTTLDSKVIVAVTEADDLADFLCSLAPWVTDVIIPGHGQRTETRFSAFLEQPGGELSPLALIPDEEEKKAVLQALVSETDLPHLDIYASQPINASSSRININCRTLLDVDEGLAYWTAPRRMELNSAVVDYSAFSSRSRDFRLYPRLGRRTHVTRDAVLGTLTLRVNGEILPGQGFEVRWSHV